MNEKDLGPDHLWIAPLLNGLADLYRTQGRYTQAEPFYMRALAVREKAFRSDPLNVAESLHILGDFYHTQGVSAQAEPFYPGRWKFCKEPLAGPSRYGVEPEQSCRLVP
jgi:tetratricopeptide (TPR) repeat protein